VSDEKTNRSGVLRLEDDSDRAERVRNDVNFDDEQWNDETADFRLVRHNSRFCAASLKAVLCCVDFPIVWW
jgi:hypothetical protein